MKTIVYEKKMKVLLPSLPRALVILITFIALQVFTVKAATSVSQFGITWHFEEDEIVGQFVNGDFWVVGPVTITSITPRSVDGMNGSMVDIQINGSQGFDGRMKGVTYEESKNVALNLPLTLPGGSSLVSSESYVTNASGDKPQLKTIAVLTVLSEPASPDKFRPPYQGTNKALEWSFEDVNWDSLGKLPVIPISSDLSAVTAKYGRPWIEYRNTYVGRYTHPRENMPAYGREIAHHLAPGLLSLQMDYSNEQKKDLLIRMIQIGIDIYGHVRLGGAFSNDGGHNYGRKMPMLLAGRVLNHPGMLEYSDTTKHEIFQEDQQTFYVSQEDIDRDHVPAVSSWSEPVEYLQTDLGMPEWGFKHHHWPKYDNKAWNAKYREMFGSMMGHILTAHIMGVTNLWNDEAVFDYADRYWEKESVNAENSANKIHLFVHDMWAAYRDSSLSQSSVTKPSIVPNGGSFLNPANVVLSSALEDAEIYYSLDGSVPTVNSLLYTTPITMAESGIVNAISVHKELGQSPIQMAEFEIGEFISSINSWKNVAIPEQDSSFVISFDVIPLDDAFDGVIGLSELQASEYSDLAAIIRFSPEGIIDARNGSAYQAKSLIQYEANATYQVEMEIDLSNKKYSAIVTSAGVSPVVVALDYSFRIEQSDVNNLSNIVLTTEGSSYNISNIQVAGRPSPPDSLRVVVE